ncbi:Xyloglucanase Xgh74A precursor [Symmachiella macrocystis]|uniref:Xyloglucanase Xgh74A n=1 Tax=Symmachiella macrocystis TaxID=2527985 RepID=A0A5C6AU08_9PLAN|nr:glycosyl hydrolase [Symmachiella macrocystis]TWU03078.1 Xyloglucanase Xgh74A precursor [Symmachiella macrocystis]
MQFQDSRRIVAALAVIVMAGCVEQPPKAGAVQPPPEATATNAEPAQQAETAVSDPEAAPTDEEPALPIVKDEFQQSIQALEWRNIGPFNGGRGTSVVGHPTDRNVFYFGHSSGGLWKTEDAGAYWIPVGDGQFRYASVGAIALHEKNPDIMYVGLGEPQMRQSVSWGDGMYKTTDGGETWTHLGLEEARQISKVIIHPDDPNRVYVASMGHTWGESPERGVFRTKDGGKTWDKVLFKSDKTGAIDMAMSPENPNILFAALWEFERKAWGAKTAGPEGGLWKSTDGGDTWQEITRNQGLPDGMWGRVGLDMSAADPNRVYALIDNETKQGLYRSDDLGETWRFVSDDANITARPFYFYHLHADPSNADNLWVPGNKLWRSMDAGKTWVLEPGIKDDFQDCWIDPKDPDRMIVTCDGGTQVTLTGGKTWSSFANQSGVQFYRVDTDDQFPYRVYGNAQDLLVYSVPSSSRWGGIPLHMTDSISSGETGRAVPKPGDPNIVYSLATGATYGGATHFTVNNVKTGQTEPRSVWPEILFGTPASEFKYRFNWQAPFLVSPHDPKTIYMAGNVVFRTRDEGMTWEKISDDLTHNMEDKMKVAGAPWLPEYFGQETFSTIHRLVESPHEKGVLWAGSDDGLVHLTRDGGKTWNNVTPPGLPELSGIYEIEVSPHDAATVYIAITRYRKADDYSPYLLKTADYGKTWKRLDSNFSQDEITRTIREDTVRKGLLFVGTETGIYTSIDDGNQWRRLNLNMPSVPVHDIEVKNADLVIATHGRGFWILDDINPLRQYTPELARKTAHLFKPEDHTRFGYNWWIDYGGGPPSDEKYFFVRNAEPGYTFYERGTVNGERKREFIDAGEGRPLGVIIDYLVSDQAKEISLTILDEDGNEIRTFGKDDISTETFENIAGREYGGNADAMQATASVGKGLNRFIWDMRYPPVSQIPGRPPVVINPIAKPGTYQVRLTVDGKSQTQSFELKVNPNETYTRVQTDEKGKAWMALYEQSEKTVQAILKAAEAKKKAVKAAKADPTLKDAADEVAKVADKFEASMVSTGTTLVQIISEPTKPLAFLTSLHNLLEHTEGPPNKPWYQVFEKYSGEIDVKIAEFDKELGKVMAPFE